jgi:formylglycine-generating enzyme required for sulfatase activity
MATDLNVAGITQTGSSGGFSYAVSGPSGVTPAGANSSSNRPIAYVSWFDAARFANWMHNGATNGASTETGAYTLNGATSGIFMKNVDARWWIPTLDEWYKAAYYMGGGSNAGYRHGISGNNIGGASNQANHDNGVYSVTQSQSYRWGGIISSTQNYLTDVGAFSNSASAYGTYDQRGNLAEWNDAVGNYYLYYSWLYPDQLDQLGVTTNSAGQSLEQFADRGILGGSWGSQSFELPGTYEFHQLMNPTREGSTVGFRVASLSSPATNIILTVEKTTSLSGQWQFDREINVGPMTNTNEFYRLKIRTVVE